MVRRIIIIILLAAAIMAAGCTVQQTPTYNVDQYVILKLQADPTLISVADNDEFNIISDHHSWDNNELNSQYLIGFNSTNTTTVDGVVHTTMTYHKISLQVHYTPINSTCLNITECEPMWDNSVLDGWYDLLHKKILIAPNSNQGSLGDTYVEGHIMGLW